MSPSSDKSPEAAPGAGKRERLQKYLAQAGVGSRRHCEQLIRAGRVTVDGLVASLGSSVDPAAQSVAVDGVEVTREPLEYWLLNKPLGVVSTAFDPQGRPTVVEYVPAQGRVYPVGRLDLDSTGLILLTNDGELAARLLHPRYGVEKEYVVTVEGLVSPSVVAQLKAGIQLADGLTAPAAVEILPAQGSQFRGPTTTLRIVIREGRKRQVRRMMETAGHPVLRLHRCRFAGLTDEGLALGQARPLTAAELAGLVVYKLRP